MSEDLAGYNGPGSDTKLQSNSRKDEAANEAKEQGRLTVNPRTLLLTLAAAFTAVGLYGLLTGNFLALPYLLLALLSFALASLVSIFSGGRPSRRTAVEGSRDVQELAATGRKIEAIKLHRQQTGVGLAEAKTYVDSLSSGMPVEPQGVYALPLPAELEEDVRTIVTFGNKLEAIKRVRELTGVGLKEAKVYVEGLARR